MDYLWYPTFHLIHILTRFTNSFYKPHRPPGWNCSVLARELPVPLIVYPTAIRISCPWSQITFQSLPLPEAPPAQCTQLSRQPCPRRLLLPYTPAPGGHGTFKPLLESSYFTWAKPLTCLQAKLPPFSVYLATHLPAKLPFPLWYWLMYSLQLQPAFLVAAPPVASQIFDLPLSPHLLPCLLQHLTPMRTPRILSSPRVAQSLNFLGALCPPKKLFLPPMAIPHFIFCLFVFNLYPK